MLPDHQAPGKRALIVARLNPEDRRKGARNNVVVFEVARSDDGIEIVSIHPSPNRTIDKARQLLEEMRGSDGQRARGRDPRPFSEAAPSSGLRDIRADEPSINTDTATFNAEATAETDRLAAEIEALRSAGRLTAEDEAVVRSIADDVDPGSIRRGFSALAACLTRGK